MQSPRLAAAGDALVVLGLTAATAAVIACWLPIFQVGGFIYRIVEEHRGHAYTIAAAIVPLGVAIAALLTRLPTPRTARGAALAASAIGTLAPVDHLAETLWRRKHPERFGSPFDIRYGYTVARPAGRRRGSDRVRRPGRLAARR